MGLIIRGNELTLKPVIPSDWSGFELSYTHGSSVYELIVHNTAPIDAIRSRLDDEPYGQSTITLSDDGQDHRFELWLG